MLLAATSCLLNSTFIALKNEIVSFVIMFVQMKNQKEAKASMQVRGHRQERGRRSARHCITEDIQAVDKLKEKLVTLF